MKTSPSLWSNEVVEVTMAIEEGKERMTISFDYPANEEFGISAGRATINFFRSKKRLDDYVILPKWELYDDPK